MTVPVIIIIPLILACYERGFSLGNIVYVLIICFVDFGYRLVVQNEIKYVTQYCVFVIVPFRFPRLKM
jgi:uncharacterized membrane protein YjdF